MESVTGDITIFVSSLVQLQPFAEDEFEPEGKRRRGPPEYNEIERKLQDLIARVGEKVILICLFSIACFKTGSSSLESNLESLCSVLEGDLERYKTKILEVISAWFVSHFFLNKSILSSVVLLPEKLTIYSTLVGLLNAKNFNFGGDIVEKMTAVLHEKLSEESFEPALNVVS